MYSLAEKRIDLKTKTDQNCTEIKTQRKITVSRCTYYFSPTHYVRTYQSFHASYNIEFFMINLWVKRNDNPRELKDPAR